ncbi:peptide chain release factor N(5)-glutamine methyltransferase [Flavimaribacter sediminis]|uniref:peptide chain release factor N(5)-glutamine methyltransferase n=1 Tax=Flavimaribacter sediminis TaxID=2865987 RepID=UPI00351DBFE0
MIKTAPEFSAATIAEAVKAAGRQFAEAGLEAPERSAQILICGLLDIGLTELVLDAGNALDVETQSRVASAVARAVNGEPVHRILGRREFYGLELQLNEETLEPRPDTEILVDAALPHVTAIAARQGGCDILDLGTGTGAIALAILSHVKQARALGVDISEKAVLAATQNARRHGLGERFRATTGDWFDNISDRFDVIVSNPPYIRRSDIDGLSDAVRRHDPVRALDGGQDGLDAYRIIARETDKHLRQGGRIVLETGFDQHDAVIALFDKHGLECLERRRDLGGRDRVLAFARKAL